MINIHNFLFLLLLVDLSGTSNGHSFSSNPTDVSRILQTYNETNNGIYNVSAQPNADKRPKQLHINPWISKHGDYKSGKTATMFVWVSDINYDCPPTVEIYNEEGNNMLFTVDGNSMSSQFIRRSNHSFLNSTDLPMITYVSPFIHNVTVDGLDADTYYNYRVGARCESNNDVAWTADLIKFKTPILAGATLNTNGQEQVLAIAGDLGQTKYTKNTIDNILNYVGSNSSSNFDPESLIILGDLAYADGDAGLRWDTYQQLVEPLTSQVNTYVMPGNHEVWNEFDAVTNDAMVNYVNRYFMPGNYSDPTSRHPKQFNISSNVNSYDFDVEYIGGSSYYSVEQGLVTFIALNTYNGHKYGLGTHMYEWLEETLKNVDRSVTPWVIVGMHAPWYNTNAGHTYDPTDDPDSSANEIDTAGMAEHYEPLFNRYKVNMVFSGHVHAYERFHSTGLNATCEDDTSGPTYITVGDGGNHEQLSSPEILTDFYQLKCSAYRNNEYYGFGFLKIHNESVAEWIWMPNPEGSERIPEFGGWDGSTNFAKVSRMQRGYVDQAYVDNYALIVNDNNFENEQSKGEKGMDTNKDSGTSIPTIDNNLAFASLFAATMLAIL